MERPGGGPGSVPLSGIRVVVGLLSGEGGMPAKQKPARVIAGNVFTVEGQFICAWFTVVDRVLDKRSQV